MENMCAHIHLNAYMRLNGAKDMSINVSIDCLYISMTFTATNEQTQTQSNQTKQCSPQQKPIEINRFITNTFADYFELSKSKSFSLICY